MPAQLLSLSDGPSILLDKPVLLIGRHPECDIQIDSRKVSRRHCCIAHVNDYLVVRDLGSTNGVRINGVRVIEGKLRRGDELTIGNSRYRVRWEDVEGPPGAAARPAAPPAKVARPVRSAQLPDEILEGAEDPVPLEDAEDSPPPAGRARPAPPAAPPAAPRSPLTRVEPPEAPLFPDELELAPASDVRPPPSPSP